MDFFNVTIPSYEPNGDDQLFNVRVAKSRDNYNDYVVRRRYQQFEALHSTLNKAFNGVPAFTPLSYPMHCKNTFA